MLHIDITCEDLRVIATRNNEDAYPKPWFVHVFDTLDGREEVYQATDNFMAHLVFTMIQTDGTLPGNTTTKLLQKESNKLELFFNEENTNHIRLIP